MIHAVLVSFNEGRTDTRHEAGEVADLSHIPDLADLIANGTVRELDEEDASTRTQRMSTEMIDEALAEKQARRAR